MTFERKRLIGIGAAIVVAVAGGGAAIAASGHHGSADTNHPGFGGPPPGYGPRGEGFRGDGFGPGGNLQAASSYLRISVQTLLSDLRSGRTLAQVADATSGKSSAGLVAALVAAEKARVQQAVASGRLTQAQADRVESDLRARVQTQVSGVDGRDGGFGPPDGDRHGFGPGGDDDDGGDGGNPAPTTTVPPTHI